MQLSALIPYQTGLNKRSHAHPYTSHLVTVPAGQLMCCLQPVLGVFLSLELNLGVKVVCRHGDQVTSERMST